MRERKKNSKEAKTWRLGEQKHRDLEQKTWSKKKWRLGSKNMETWELGAKNGDLGVLGSKKMRRLGVGKR